jgi:hypothetical protein
MRGNREILQLTLNIQVSEVRVENPKGVQQ